MIYTLTFNPALDYIIQVPTYTEGIVNRTVGEKILPGGKGINVSIVLNSLGVPSTALGFAAGFTGTVLTQMLAEQGIQSDFIYLQKGFSRINVKIKARQETEINGQGPEIDAKALTLLYEKLGTLAKGDILILAGSVPNTLPDSTYREIMEHLAEKNLTVVVDATGSLLTNTLELRPFLIKPNLAELEEIFDKKLHTDEEIADCAKELCRRGAENVLVSMGGKGALLVTGAGQVFYHPAPKGRVINSTGAGDSMVAGFLAGYLKTQDMMHALRLGICAGSASAFSQNLATKDAIRSLERGILESKK
ncbi:MAG: 1-phosphofructokinase [Clostridia bacterium]|nr:1-phosphofructokinase [Clostridia bacterium]